MSLTEHAKQELEMAGFFDKGSDYGGELGNATLELVKLFAKQGHSGISAGIVRNLFNKLADYKPLSPLTFNDDEWSNEIARSDNVYQNKRNSAVFKDGMRHIDIERDLKDVMAKVEELFDRVENLENQNVEKE